MLAVLSVLGFVVMVFAFAMLLPLVWALTQHDPAEMAFIMGFFTTLTCGWGLWLATRRHRRELQPRDGFLLVTLVWTVLPVFATLPLLFYFHSAGTPMSFTDAYFETVSGLTTTGATVITGLNKLPTSINVWRCLMVFMGGMGIIVLAVAILPLLGVGGSQVFKAETAGPLKDEKLTPRMAQTARALWTIYFVLAVACFAAYRIAGMSWTDAFMHMCTTVSLGGFSSYDASFAQFNSAAIEWVAVVFMVLAGLNFALYFVVVREGTLRPLLGNSEARSYLLILLGACMLITLYLLETGTYNTAEDAFRYTLFNVVSIATTTGYANTDYAQWPIFAPVLMLFLCSFVTCAGSTGGGIKMVRAIILLRQTRRELTRIMHPRVINPLAINGQIVENSVIYAVLAFMLIYGGVLIFMTLLLLFSGLDVVTAFTAVVAMLNNLGPGLGQVGPSGNYQNLTDFQTWVCIVTMLLGRLELFTVMVLFTRQFWRR
jgi:trk system potassium uptake protein TrkH